MKLKKDNKTVEVSKEVAEVLIRMHGYKEVKSK